MHTAVASPRSNRGNGTLAALAQPVVRRRRRAWLGALAGVVLLVAGCGQAAKKPIRPPSRGSGIPASLAGADLKGLSWIGQSDGWALFGQRCPGASCARLLHTSDGGIHWHLLPVPPATVVSGIYECQKGACVSGVSFANRKVGYLYGPALLMSTDSGRSWQAQRGRQVEALAVSGGRVYRVAYGHVGCPGPCRPVLQVAPTGSTAWRTVIGQLAPPGRSATAQIVASGSSLLVALFGSQAGPVPAYASLYRSSNGGSSWERHRDPCSGRGPHRKRQEEDLTALAAAAGRVVAGLCTPHLGTGGFVIKSTDSGASWRTDGALPHVQFPHLIAAASSTTLAVSTGPMGGGGVFTAELLISTDGGHHWHLAATDRQHLTGAGAPAWLGFQDSTVGRWIGDPHGVWVTHRAGTGWTRTAFP